MREISRANQNALIVSILYASAGMAVIGVIIAQVQKPNVLN